MLPEYYDPFSGRTLTKGEVGCFLSHYSIWKEVRDLGGDTGTGGDTSTGQGPHVQHRLSGATGRGFFPQSERAQYGPVWPSVVLGRVHSAVPSLQIVSRGLERSVVFEDDVRFEVSFPARLRRLMEELEGAQQDWDLM